MKKILLGSLVLISGVLLTACGNKTDEKLGDIQTCSLGDGEEITDCDSIAGETENLGENQSNTNYLVLVNKENKLPEDWESKIELVAVQNAFDETIMVEKEALEKYNELRDDLMDEGVDIELDSVYRSVSRQEELRKEFEEKYGIDYVKQYVAVPGYSEHHTALAIDICIKKDGVLIYENEDMIAEPEIFEKIHKKLADYGFILRYLDGKEDITGYGYEPRHLRYVGDINVAKEIMEKGITLEEYLDQLNK